MRDAPVLAVALAGLFVFACASHQTGAHSVALAEGTYRVVARTCDGGEVEKATCNWIRYIELVRGKFHGVSDEELAIVQWIGVDAEAGPYTYNARPLRGHAQGDQYIIDEIVQSASEAREWFELENGRAIAYRFQKHSKGGAGNSAVSFALQLSPLVRDAALAERLPYPEPLLDE
jgi:hypothetical protein